MKRYLNILIITALLIFLQSCAGKETSRIDPDTRIFKSTNESYSLKIPDGFLLSDKSFNIKLFFRDIPENTVFFSNKEKGITIALFNTGFINLEPKIRKPFFLHYYEQDLLNFGNANPLLEVVSVERSKNGVIAELKSDKLMGIIKILLIPESEVSEKHNSFIFVACSKIKNYETAKENLRAVSESLTDK